jgi:hypothetical protein
MMDLGGPDASEGPPGGGVDVFRSNLSLSRSRSVILKRGQNIKYPPYAFTEHGAMMIASVLNSPRAAYPADPGGVRRLEVTDCDFKSERLKADISLSTSRNLQNACPGAGVDLIRKLLKRLRQEGNIKCLGLGKNAAWRKTTKWGKR